MATANQVQHYAGLARDLAAYIAALAAHDFEFEFSDDGRVYGAGAMALAALRTTQRAIDPTGAVWNEYAPRGHQLSGEVA